jgi:putative oxidoreductase
LRIWFGFTVFTHGYPKLFRIPHGHIVDPYANVIKVIANKLHFPAAEFLGLFVTLLESVGGLMLAVGLLTRFVAPMIAIQMLVISLGILWPNWAWIEHGMEYALLMSALAGYMSIRGGGKYSIDRWLGREL